MGAELWTGFKLGDRWVRPEVNQIDDTRIDAKAMEVLVALAEASPAVVSGSALLDRVWPDVVVVPNVVYQAIAQLRKALGDEARAARYIECIPRRGYRIIVDVTHDGMGVAQLGGVATRLARHNLPAELTSFVGREGELTEVNELLGQHRLVTIIGFGGCGKSRLALTVAAAQVSNFPDGVWLVELAPLTDPLQVEVAVAKVLRVRDISGEAIRDRLIDALADKQMLLILDNCEHLIEACAECVDSILRRTDGVRILATSREALAVQGERAWRIQPLGTVEPLNLPSLEQLDQVESIRLFIDRARVRMPEIALSAENAGALAQISRRLEGIPLAIELAAARVRDLSIEEICSRIGGDSMQLLTGGARTSLARQRTMQATLDWSHSLLAEAERMLLRRLSVFARGFTLEAAEAIADCAPSSPKWILNALMRLVDQSMVLVVETAGRARFRLLEPVRQYSCERLLSSGEEKLIRDRHRDYFLSLGESLGRDLNTPNPRPGLFPRFLSEQEEFELVLSRSLEHDPEIGLQLVASLAPIWGELELTGNGHWLEDFLARTTGMVHARARVLRYAGVFALSRFDAALAKSRFQESAVLARESCNRDELAPSLIFLAGVSDTAEAQAALDEAWDVARATGDPHLRMYCLLQAVERLPPHEFAKRRTLLEESAALARSVGDAGALVWVLKGLMSGWVNVEQRLDLARCALEELLRIARFFGNPRWTAHALMEFGMLAELEGDFLQAEKLMMEGESISGEIDPENIKARIPLGRVLCKLGEVDRGVSMIREGLRRSVGPSTQFDVHGCWLALSSLAVVACMADQHARAARLFGAVDGIMQTYFPGAPSAGHWKICCEPLAKIKSALGDTAYEALRAEGVAMTPEQAAALALQDEHQSAA